MLVDRFKNAFQQLKDSEVDTGLKFIDGRPIYMNYLKIDLGNSSLTREVNIGANNFDYLWIDGSKSCLWSANGSDQYFYPVNYGNDVNVHFHGNNLIVSLKNTFTGWANVFYIFYCYVKKK